MHDIEIPAQKQHAHNGAPGSPIEQKCHFFLSTLLNKTENWCFDYENNDTLHRMSTQNVRKKIPHTLHFKWTILIKYFTSYIKKCQTGTNFFGWVYIIYMYTYVELSNAAKKKKKNVIWDLIIWDLKCMFIFSIFSINKILKDIAVLECEHAAKIS